MVRMVFAAIIAVSTAGLVSRAEAVPEPSCQGRVENELKILVQAAAETHHSFVSQNEKLIQESLDRVIGHIDCTNKLSRQMKVHDRRHLLTMLAGIRVMAVQAKVARGEKRDEVAQDVFRQMAHMSRIYNVAGSYQIFFCDADKSFWLQAGTHPLNPIHPQSLRSCGLRIPAGVVSNHYAE